MQQCWHALWLVAEFRHTRLRVPMLRAAESGFGVFVKSFCNCITQSVVSESREPRTSRATMMQAFISEASASNLSSHFGHGH